MFLYYMAAIDEMIGHIVALKIGVAEDVDERLKQLQTGCPHALFVLKSIECKDKASAHRLEGRMHNRFSSDNLQGEWFEVSVELMREIFN